MKKLLLILHSLIIITILGCQENKNNNSVYQNQGVIIDSISEIHDDWLTEGILKNRKKDGLWKTYYFEYGVLGPLWKEVNWVDGKKQGYFKVYQDYEFNVIEVEGRYENDTFEGEWRQYYKNGSVSLLENWKRGKLHGIHKYFNHEGELKDQGYFVNGQKDGLWVHYHDQKHGNIRNISSEENYRDGERHGLTKSYYNDGSIRSKWYWKNGIRHAVSKNYYKNGQLELKQTWDNNGELKSEINYSENGIEIMLESDTVSYYICYNEDNESSLNLSIGFNNKSRALSVKYKGMNSSMDLIFIKQENENPGGAYPVLASYYKEMYQEKVNGEYKLTHSGIWDLVEYTRGKDSKKFNFTIDRNSNSYSYTACF